MVLKLLKEIQFWILNLMLKEKIMNSKYVLELQNLEKRFLKLMVMNLKELAVKEKCRLFIQDINYQGRFYWNLYFGNLNNIIHIQ